VDHTDQPTLGDERCAHEAPNSHRSENRVVQVGRVDVVDDDGLVLSGDPTGEPCTHGDAHALTDLVLDPGRRGGHQITGRLVDQQHGGSIDLEGLPA
jgi:hypothetical protein